MRRALGERGGSAWRWVTIIQYVCSYGNFFQITIRARNNTRQPNLVIRPQTPLLDLTFALNRSTALHGQGTDNLDIWLRTTIRGPLKGFRLNNSVCFRLAGFPKWEEVCPQDLNTTMFDSALLVLCADLF